MNYESAVISCLLTDITCMKDIHDFLKVEMFNEDISKEAYKIILQNYDLGMSVSAVDLVMLLESDERPKEYIREYLQTLMTMQTLSTEVKKYAQLVRKDYQAREIKQLFTSASLKPKDVEHTITGMIRRLEELNENKEVRAFSISDIDKKYGDKYFKEHDLGIQTKVKGIDKLLLGLGKGDVTVIGARPAVGKSALALEIAAKVSEQGKRVAYFNFEMSDQQIYERLLAKYSSLGLSRIRRGVALVGTENDKFSNARGKLQSMKNLLIFSGSYSASEIRNSCNNQNFDLIIIDYLQLVKADRTYSNRASEVGDISKTIKGMAMDLKVPVIALSQLNRGITATDEPTMNNLRESGDIEQDASNIIFMWNINESGEVKGVKVDKNRQGECGKFALSYRGSEMTFEDMDGDFEKIEKEYKGYKPKTDECPFDD